MLQGRATLILPLTFTDAAAEQERAADARPWQNRRHGGGQQGRGGANVCVALTIHVFLPILRSLTVLGCCRISTHADLLWYSLQQGRRGGRRRPGNIQSLDPSDPLAPTVSIPCSLAKWHAISIHRFPHIRLQRIDNRPEAPVLDDFASAVTMEDTSATAVDFNKFFGLLPQPVVVRLL